MEHIHQVASWDRDWGIFSKFLNIWMYCLFNFTWLVVWGIQYFRVQISLRFSVALTTADPWHIVLFFFPLQQLLSLLLSSAVLNFTWCDLQWIFFNHLAGHSVDLSIWSLRLYSEGIFCVITSSSLFSISVQSDVGPPQFSLYFSHIF